MTALLRSELRKISSTRLWWGLLIGAVVWTVVNAVISAAFAGTEPGPGAPATPGLDTAEAIRGAYAGAAFTGTYMFALILGITGMTGEYRYQTITPTFLTTPRRARVVGVKLLAHLLVGAAYGIAALAAAVVSAAIVISSRGYDLGFGAERLWTTMALTVLGLALWTLIGVGIGTLITNQIVAILVAVFIWFIVEPIATFVLSNQGLDEVVKWLPTNASAAIVDTGSAFLQYLDWWAGALVMVGYAALLAGLGVLLSVRRDVT